MLGMSRYAAMASADSRTVIPRRSALSRMVRAVTLALLPLSPREGAAQPARRPRDAVLDSRNHRYRHSARHLVVGDAAGGDRRLAASRQYPQEGGRARGGDAARGVDRAVADPAAEPDRLAAAHLCADGDRCVDLRVVRDWLVRLCRAADGDHDVHRRGSRRQPDRCRTLAHAERADRHCDRAGVFVRAAVARDLFVALRARGQSARMRVDLRAPAGWRDRSARRSRSGAFCKSTSGWCNCAR